MVNIYEHIPYQQERMGRRELVNEKEFLLMQIALRAGQSVPEHKANSNVHLLAVIGQIEADLSGRQYLLKQGDMIPVAYGTPMKIRNCGSGEASFLVFKTPNPSEYRK